MKKTVIVKAKPEGIWTFVELLWTAPLRLEFVAKDQKWSFAPTNQCKADGDLLAMIDPARSILGSGPIGAVIGKIGGSSAGAKDGVATFLVGQYLAIETKPEWKGALFLTINDDPKGFQNNDGSIEVEVTIDSI